MSKKIMFSDKFGLTEAVLNGKKTQTRRLVPNGTPLGNWNETEKHAKYQVGDIVAVAQSYRDISNEVFGFATKVRGKEYRAGWGNKMFVKADLMPHHIRITNVRVERLQDISEDDCMAEGVVRCEVHMGYYTRDCGDCAKSPREAYAILIDKVSGKGTWESNPWVFVYEFEKVD